MVERVSSKEPLSKTFELPGANALRNEFLRIVRPPSSLSIPSAFVNLFMDFIVCQYPLSALPVATPSFLKSKLRQFLNEVIRANLAAMNAAGSRPEEFFDNKIKPNIFALQFVLRLVFESLEKEQADNMRVTALMQSLDEHGKVHDELTSQLRVTQASLTSALGRVGKDSLTGLQNREAMTLEMQSISRQMPNQPCTVIMLDLDHFKRVNDSLGHLAGDEVLKQLVKVVLDESLFRFENICRWGGEEFLIIIPCELAKGIDIANRIRAVVENYFFRVPDGLSGTSSLQKTLSCGIAGCVGSEVTQDAVIGEADFALYLAKGKQFDSEGAVLKDVLGNDIEDKDGRNRVWVYGREEAEPREATSTAE